MEPIKRAPPVSIHEAMITRHYARDAISRETVSDAALDAMVAAMTAARQSAERAQKIVDAALRNEMESGPRRQKVARDGSFKAVEGALKALDVARAVAKKEMDMLRAVTSAPPGPRDAIGNMIAAEIRRTLQSMPLAERKATIAAAIAADETEIVAAAIGAGTPGLLIGLSAVEVEMQRTNWRQKAHPSEVDRLARLERALGDVDMGGDLLIKFIDGLTNAAEIAAAEKTAQAAADAMAAE